MSHKLKARKDSSASRNEKKREKEAFVVPLLGTRREERKKTPEPRPKFIPKPRKFLTPLHKKFKKLEDEHERLEQSYQERRKKHFAEGGPLQKRAAVRMERILKQAAAVAKKLGAFAPAKELFRFSEREKEKRSELEVLVSPAHEKMIVSPEDFEQEQRQEPKQEQKQK